MYNDQLYHSRDCCVALLISDNNCLLIKLTGNVCHDTIQMSHLVFILVSFYFKSHIQLHPDGAPESWGAGTFERFSEKSNYLYSSVTRGKLMFSGMQ